MIAINATSKGSAKKRRARADFWTMAFEEVNQVGTSRRGPSPRRHGQVLVEFAIISMIVCMLLAGMISFGLILFKANVTEQAADVGAQELARMPLNPVNGITPGNENGYLDDVLYADVTAAGPAYQAVRRQIFDEKYLFLNTADMTTNSLWNESASWPLLNRLLVPAMVFDAELQAYRFPGAVVDNSTTGVRTVLVPLVTGRDAATGVETIEWHHVVEEVKFTDGGAAIGQFSVAAVDPASGTFSPGVVALRIYTPVQTPMVGFQPNPANVVGEPPLSNVEYQIEGNDAGVTLNDPNGLMQKYTPVVAADSSHGNTEGGEYGLGSFYYSTTFQGRPATIVRPFRKVVIGQGVYRREVFGL